MFGAVKGVGGGLVNGNCPGVGGLVDGLTRMQLKGFEAIFFCTHETSSKIVQDGSSRIKN